MSIEIKVPELGESIVEATINRWLKQEGELVLEGEDVVELETDKVNLSVPAAQAGVLVKIMRSAGEDVEIGDVLGLIEVAAGEVAPAPTPTVDPASVPEPSPPAVVKSTPVAKRMAEETGVNLAEVSGSGVSGRIMKQDVAESRQQPASSAPVPSPPLPSSPSPATTEARRETRQRMSRRRQTIAKRLVEAQQTAAMLTTFNEINMQPVMDIRKRRRDSFVERNEVRLGFMSFFTKAVIGALKAFPLVNAAIDGDEVVLKHYYDIGIAVGVEEGLVVPVLRDADSLSFADIEKAIRELAGKAQNGTLSLADLQGGTFTITNGGVYGSLLSTPILNLPQVGILGLHKIEDRPIAMKGEVVIRPMMYVALSYDHCLIDGSDAVRFLVRVKELIEDPELLLLEG